MEEVLDLTASLDGNVFIFAHFEYGFGYSFVYVSSHSKEYSCKVSGGKRVVSGQKKEVKQIF